MLYSLSRVILPLWVEANNVYSEAAAGGGDMKCSLNVTNVSSALKYNETVTQFCKSKTMPRNHSY